MRGNRGTEIYIFFKIDGNLLLLWRNSSGEISRRREVTLRFLNGGIVNRISLSPSQATKRTLVFLNVEEIEFSSLTFLFSIVFKPGPNRHSDRVELWTENNLDWVNAKIQLKSNHLKTLIWTVKNPGTSEPMNRPNSGSYISQNFVNETINFSSFLSKNKIYQRLIKYRLSSFSFVVSTTHKL